MIVKVNLKRVFLFWRKNKNGLPVIKEKKHIQNGGTGRNLIRSLGAVTTSAGLALGEIGGAKVQQRYHQDIQKNVLKFFKIFQNYNHQLSSSNRILGMQGLNCTCSQTSVSKGKTPKSTKKHYQLFLAHVRTNKLFSDILKTHRNTGMKSIKIIDTFIQETTESFLNPVQDGDLFMQLNNLEPLVILRIIIKVSLQV